MFVTAPAMSKVSMPSGFSCSCRSHLPGKNALAPDFVAEILSPDDRPGEYLAKVAQWLDAGTRLVWVIDPQRAEARVYREDGSLTIVGQSALLDGEAVLPGFSCPLSEILR